MVKNRSSAGTKRAGFAFLHSAAHGAGTAQGQLSERKITMAINSLSSASYGLSGLASGIDSQSFVESALAGINSKIEKNQQKSTQLQYKKELYQGITTKLTEFQKKYLDYASAGSTNMRSDSFFNNYAITSESKAFSVSIGDSSAVTLGNHTIDYIKQVATSAQIKSGKNVSSQLTGIFDAQALRYENLNIGTKLKFTVDGTTKEIDIRAIAGNDSANDTVSQLNKLLKAANVDVTATMSSGKVTFAAGGSKSLTIAGDAEALSAVGLNGSTFNANGKISGNLATESLLPSVNVTLDGNQKTIHYSGSTVEAVRKSLQADLEKKFGKAIAVGGEGDKITLSVPQIDDEGEIIAGTSDPSRSVSLSGTTSQMNVFGLKSGASSKMSLGSRIGDASWATPISGSLQEFSINGVMFSFDSGSTISEVISSINNSDAGVTVSYSELQDKFIMKSTSEGAGSTLDSSAVVQTSGNLLTAMFGVEGGRGATGATLSTNLSSKSTYTDGSFRGGSFTLRINGSSVSVAIAEKAEGYTRDELVSAIDTAINNNEQAKAAGVEISASSLYNDRFELTAKDGYDVSIIDPGEGLSLLGFASGQGNGETTQETSLSALGIKDTVTFKIESDKGTIEYTAEPWYQVEDVVSGLKQAFKDFYTTAAGGWAPSPDFDVTFTNGRLNITGIDERNNSGVPTLKIEGDNGVLFGTSQVSFRDTLRDSSGNAISPEMQNGKNAIFSYNGSIVTRSTNEFTIDGLSFQLKRATKNTYTDRLDASGNPVLDGNGKVVQDISTEEDGNVGVSRDVESIMKNIKQFVTDYNEIVTYCNGLLNADATYKDYMPLTSEQEASMSERQVELWEEKSKEGLLRNDSTVTSVLTQLRSTLYQKSANSDLALYHIGITTLTTLDAKYSGTLTFGDDGEARLRKLLTEDPDSVRRLFTSTGDGLGDRLNSVLNSAVRVSAISGSSGSLVRMAGAQGVKDTTSKIYKEMVELEDTLDRLYDQYDSKYSKAWRQFNAYEKMFAQLQSQSNYMASFLGG